jgi:hypothetical protein
LRQTFLQGMECQPGTRSGAAPASVAAADISALLPGSVGQGSLVTEDQREVCRLSPRDDVAVRLNPYPAHYRPAFACSLLLYPPPLGLASRFAFPAGRPAGETTGLPRSAGVTVRVRSCFSAGGASAAPEKFGASGLDHLPFWSKRLSTLRLASLTAFTSTSLVLTIPHDPGSQPPGCWESRSWPRDRDRPPERRRLRCSGSFAHHGYP